VFAVRPRTPTPGCAAGQLAIPAGNTTRRVDVFVEMDRTRRPAKNTPKFRRYDHFVTGWSTL
jgi:hypothetical protein